VVDGARDMDLLAEELRRVLDRFEEPGQGRKGQSIPSGWPRETA
jgi:hypothetical protein